MSRVVKRIGHRSMSLAWRSWQEVVQQQREAELREQYDSQMRSLQGDLEKAGASVLSRFTARWRNRTVAQTFGKWLREIKFSAHAAAQAEQCAKLIVVSLRRMCHRRMFTALQSWTLYMRSSQEKEASAVRVREQVNLWCFVCMKPSLVLLLL